MWTVWFCLGVRIGKCGEQTAAKPAWAGADQQDGVVKIHGCRSGMTWDRSPDMPINKEQ